MLNEKYATINIREYLKGNNSKIGECSLKQLLSEFSCSINPDVERFLKEQAIEFTKKNQSVTYLVISNKNGSLVGYFTLTIKPITIKAEYFSNTVKRKLARVSKLDDKNNTYTLSAYLIAQLAKNYTDGLNHQITGKELLNLAIDQVNGLQYLAGGMVVFLESENKDELMSFYKDDNNFKQFDVRKSANKESNSHTLVQMLRIL